MLFCLADSLVDGLASGDRAHDATVHALQELASARHDGCHAIYGSAFVLDAAASCIDLSAEARSVYRNIRTNLAPLKSLYDFVKRVVEIVLPSSRLEVRDEGNGRRVFKLPADLVTLPLLRPTVLMSENLIDARVYRDMTEAYLYRIRVRGGSRLRAETRGGGGSQIYAEYGSLKGSRESLCVCVVDSDRHYPDCKMGDTAAKVVAEDERQTWPLSELLVLPVHEVENLIPTAIYQECAQGNPQRTRAVQSLQAIEKSQYAEHRFYLDIKNGLRLRDIVRVGEQHPYFLYWAPVAKNGREGEVRGNPDCWCALECGETGDCACVVCDGFGDILEAVSACLHEMTAQKRAEALDDLVLRAWDQIAPVIASWLWCEPRMHTL